MGYYDRFTSWAEEFEAAPMERKRMIMSELFSRIEVDRGYEVKIEVALNYKQFLENALPQTRIADIPILWFWGYQKPSGRACGC